MRERPGVRLRLTVNGRSRRVETEPRRTLLEILREDLGLTGVKHGCESGECGACTVLLDGRPVYACLVPALSADACKVTTIEGLGPRDPVVSAFAKAGAVQCGYCTPGMVLCAKAFLKDDSAGGGSFRERARAAVSGNLCRCTGYAKILDAIALARRGSRAGGPLAGRRR